MNLRAFSQRRRDSNLIFIVLIFSCFTWVKLAGETRVKHFSIFVPVPQGLEPSDPDGVNVQKLVVAGQAVGTEKLIII